MDKTPLVLAVNDDPEMLDLVELVLNRAGIDVLKIVYPAEVERQLETTTPDLFIVDDMMPEMNGFEVCRRLRAQAALQHFPIVLMTARLQYDVYKRALATGFNDWLTLPAGWREIQAVTQRWLGWGFAQRAWHALPEIERGDYGWSVARAAAETSYIRVAALDLLAQHGLIADQAELVALLDDDETQVQTCATGHLALFPLDQTRPVLVNLLDHQKPELRAAAIEALHTYPDPPLSPLLVDLIPAETAPRVLLAALRALGPDWDRFRRRFMLRC